MRRLSLLVGSLVLTLGCGSDAFTAHPDVVAEAAGQTLSAERVAEILSSVKGIPMSAEAATFVGSLWADYTLFAQAVADDALETDSATVHEVMWREIAELTAGHWFDSLVAKRAVVTPATIDSVYAVDSVRVMQHVLVRLDGPVTADQRAAARRKIENVLSRANGGADFGALALQFSEDPAAQADSGFLPPSPRGAFVASFDSAAWLLGPGEISGIVATNFGFHVIRRANPEQAKQRLERYVGPMLVPAMERQYYAELDSIFDLQVVGNAAGKARDAMANLTKASRNNSKIVNFNDGSVTVAEFARWLQADVANPIEGPPKLEQMRALPDSILSAGVEQLAGRYLFLREAERAGVSITPEEWQMVSAEFRAQVDSLTATIGLVPDVIDPAATQADRRRAAAIRVDTFFDRMVKGETQVRLLPGMLTWALRETRPASVNPAGVQHAIALAQARAANDSSGTPTTPSRPQLEPAPGGPPISEGAGTP